MAFRYTEVGFVPNYIPYLQGLEVQEATHHAVVDGSAPNTVLMLEHEAVYTAGRRTKPEDRPYDGAPVIDVDRGGEITWHGPGQLVVYPIIKLRDKAAVSAFVKALENVTIALLARYGITGEIVEGRPGVWLRADDLGPARKIAAIGLRIHHGVSKHGIAINANNDLRPFGKIVPCGISDASVTSIALETGQEVTPRELAVAFQQEFNKLELDIAALGNAPVAVSHS